MYKHENANSKRILTYCTSLKKQSGDCSKYAQKPVFKRNSNEFPTL